MQRKIKQFEKIYIRRRNQIERIGIRLFRNAIEDQFHAYLISIKDIDSSHWEAKVNTISEEPIKKAMQNYYKRFAPLALMQRKQLLSQKEEDSYWTNEFERYLLNYVNTEAGSKISMIAETTRKRTLKIVRDVLEEGVTEGFGIEKIKNNLIKTIGSELKGNVAARARAIAQTEIIGGSNRAAAYAAESTGLEFRKYWSTSGLPNIRPTHVQAENYSQSIGGLRKNQFFPNGLLYPGDSEHGTAEEVVNCRCTLLLVPMLQA